MVEEVEKSVPLKRSGMLFCLVGPSAGGKTSMGNFILDRYSTTLRRSISATTRPKREGEREGVDYYFLSESQFKEKIADNAFFEWAKIHGNLYGTLKEVVASNINEGCDLLLDIELQGVRAFRQAYPEHTVVSFIVPPTLAALKQRLLRRSTVTPEDLETRIATAIEECALVPQLRKEGLLQYFVVNDSIEQCQRSVGAIYEAERLRVGRIDSGTLQDFCVMR